MASHKSAIKAHKQNIKRRDHNRAMRTRMRGVLREIRAAIDKGNPDELKAAVSSTVSLVDKMAGKGLIHRNTAGRYKARLAARLQKRTAATAAA